MIIALKRRENPIRMFLQLFPKEIKLYTLLFTIHISRKTIFNQGRDLGDTTVNGSAFFMLLGIFLMMWIVYKNRKLIKKAIDGTKLLFCYYMICGISMVWAITPVYSTILPKFFEIFMSYLAVSIVLYKIKNREKMLIYVLYLTSIATFMGIFKSFFSLWFHTNAYTFTAMIGVVLSMGLLRYAHYRPASWLFVFNLCCLIMGTSSGSYIAFIVACVVFMSTSNRGVPILKLMIVLVLSYAICQIAEDIIYRYVFWGHNKEAIEGGTGRYEVWKIYISAWKQSPLLGFGFVAGERSLEMLGGNFNILSAHNGYLSALVGTGLFGTFFFGLFWIKSFINVYKMTQLSQVELRSKERGARSKRIPCSYIQKWQTSEQNIPLAPRSLPLAPQKLSLRNLNKMTKTSYIAGLAATIFAALCGALVNNMSYPAIGSDWYYTSTATIALFVMANTFQWKHE